MVSSGPFSGGAIAAGLSAARIKRFRLALPLYLIMAVLAGLAYRAAHVSRPLPLPDALHQRVVFDAVGIWLGVGLGFRLLLSFGTTQGLDNVRMQTELSLAHGIQATLVPTISFQNATFEVYGRSIPSAEMGGDLIDVIQSDGRLLAYIADISGHGSGPCAVPSYFTLNGSRPLVPQALHRQAPSPYRAVVRHVTKWIVGNLQHIPRLFLVVHPARDGLNQFPVSVFARLRVLTEALGISIRAVTR